jgi:hypothetical protein
VRLLTEEAVKRKLVPRVGRETVRILLESHDLKPWRKKMWCVAELAAASPPEAGLPDATPPVSRRCTPPVPASRAAFHRRIWLWNRFAVHYTPKHGS